MRAQSRRNDTHAPGGLRILDGTTLKLIALVSMVIDHVGDLFFPSATWMRVVGRIAMPVFAFCVSEGYIHTRDRQSYLLRMGVFALISEIPFDLARTGTLDLSSQNIMFTFFLALGALTLFDYIAERYEGAQGLVMGIGAVAAIAVGSVFLGAEYNFSAIGLVFIFYLLRDQDPFIRDVSGAAFLALVRNVGIYRWSILGIIPIALYNGKRGRGLKLLFYVFYPAHLLVLYLVKLLVG
ncbi:MAG: hypothetical protein IJ092_12115 [Atopobiaceae bacterium]|nr:hypothetical protein [Atopobiaceae bacterium]MBR1830606.1 hypothetical protein [Atopobiaceae bacterium]